KHRPESGRSVCVDVAGEQHDRRHEDDELLEGVHLHAEIALEHLVTGSGRSGDAKPGACPGNRPHEEEELRQGETDHQVNEGHRGSVSRSEWHNALMGDKERGYAHRIDVRAGAEEVWRALTDTELLGRWCSPGAEIRARPGGLFRASVDRSEERRVGKEWRAGREGEPAGR